MKRIFWIGVGVTATILVIRKGRQLREKYSPPAIVNRAIDDLGERADDVGGRVVDAARSFGADLRDAMALREAQLRAAVLSQGQPDPDDVRRERAATSAGQEFPGRSGRLDEDEDDDLPYSF